MIGIRPKFIVGVVVAALAAGIGLTVVTDVPFLSNPTIAVETPWEIALFEGDTLDTLAQTAERTRPIISKDTVTGLSAGFVADPFWIEKSGSTYVFFEVWNDTTRQGDLAVAVSSGDNKWKYLGVALDEPFHLSYPQVFLHDGEYYMVPESGAVSELRLYRATEFPLKWELVTKLMDGRFADPTIVHLNGRWWLFASKETGLGRLDLFYADALEGPWHPHPANPIVANDKNISRPGGRIVVAGDRVYRITQDGDPDYGMSISAVEILEMTPESYRERPAFSGPLLGNEFGVFSRSYIHQLDTKRTADGRWLALVDRREKILCGATPWFNSLLLGVGLAHPGCRSANLEGAVDAPKGDH